MYYQPDDIWSIYNVTSREEYVEKFVLKGYFHSSIPIEIRNSYKTVEFLMAHAYYHWQMYDEALKKLLGIFEMAIKLKCKNEGIEVTYLNKKGKKKNKDLSVLIDQLSKSKKEIASLNSILHNVRELRNYFSHPNDYSFMGGIAKQSIEPLVNLINQLFLSSEYKENEESELKIKKEEFNLLKDRLFSYNVDNVGNILVYTPVPIYTMEINDNYITLWELKAVYNNTIELLKEHKIPDPIVLFLKDEVKLANGMSAFEFQTNKEIKLFETLKKDNLDNLNEHINAIEKAENIDSHIFESSQKNYIHKSLESFKYRNYWMNK